MGFVGAEQLLRASVLAIVIFLLRIPRQFIGVSRAASVGMTKASVS